MPGWVDEAVSNFAKRFGQGIHFSLVEVATASRGRADNPTVYQASEGQSLLSHVDTGDWVVALEVGGKSRTTEALSSWLQQRIEEARPLVFLIGGPDGLSKECRARANEQWSLSDLTLPHGLARVVVVEALYRANSLRLGHPYHRA